MRLKVMENQSAECGREVAALEKNIQSCTKTITHLHEEKQQLSHRFQIPLHNNLTIPVKPNPHTLQEQVATLSAEQLLPRCRMEHIQMEAKLVDSHLQTQEEKVRRLSIELTQAKRQHQLTLDIVQNLAAEQTKSSTILQVAEQRNSPQQDACTKLHTAGNLN